MSTLTNRTKHISSFTNEYRYGVVLATEAQENITTEDGYELLLDIAITSWNHRIKN